MKLQYLLVAFLSSAAMQPATAQTVQPRFAESVQPRFADAVQPRHAPPLPASTPTEGNERQASAQLSASPATLRWNAVGDSPLVREGVGRGMQLRRVACAGVQCRMFESTAGDMVVRAETVFRPVPAGSTLQVQVYDQRMQPVGPSRSRGVSSDGSFWDDLSTYQLPAGDYQVRYALPGSDSAYAAVKFSVSRTAPSKADTRAGGPAAPSPAREAAIDAARRNQLCWSKTVNNSDWTCR